ncbi:molybdate ABC transporter substrate-binding protein [Vibrio tapetis]|uniref:Molybdate transporter subunit periplasmic-binding component of ABC superfamily n=1 Tax=Vibrio tapetis subsp. tapetis TaxID=1671868 RepID=A0A2N8ZNA8_9VIBR|nr:molybdate ABC transporter substrate-binding protein [Vibrio tapetis]SON53339.1 molybdate transporter subunit; periplasmic-binding component of ABC superfamily [Vibrio tapetis subsp. tapetis]
MRSRSSIQLSRLQFTCLGLILSLVSFSSAAQVRVLAASSMTNVLSDIAIEFEQTHGIEVQLVFAGSSSLARQIEQGAPADLYISANTKWADYLVSQGLIDKTAINVLARNKLVVIAPNTENTTKFSYEVDEMLHPSWWENKLNGGRLAIGNPNAVPAGMYAKQALKHQGIWDFVKNSLAPTNNVRIALTLVARQEAPLGIVYATDAKISDSVMVLGEFPSGSYDDIEYPLVQLNDKAETRSLVEFLLSSRSKGMIVEHGFVPVN